MISTKQQPWSATNAEAWYRAQPWLVGCNFIPNNAVNQLEMWQSETFDPDIIARELGWASRLGFNTARVYLHDLAYAADPSGFIDRVQRYLAIADKHSIRSILVLFDDCWNPTPAVGKQPAPEPHRHNSHWLQSPGLAQLERFPHDAMLRQRLEKYVKEILMAFANDPRVILWDLYNEPGGWMREDSRRELVGERCLPLLEEVFGWAREVAPSQPLTSGVWNCDYREGKLGTISRLQMQNSDIVSFHNYSPPELMEKDILLLKKLTGRPLICTEYLARPSSRFQTILPILKQHGVGAINWGLVAGKTQTIYPWDSWDRPYRGEPSIWHHDILRPDGTAFDETEVRLIQALTETGRGKAVRSASDRHATKTGELHV